MQKIRSLILSVIAILLTAVVPLGAVSAQAPDEKPQRNVCGGHTPEAASCHARVVTKDKSIEPDASVSYSNGYKPSDLVSAYKLPALPAAGTPFAWNGQTVAVVDAFDNPNAAADLLAYRKQFNLPLCQTANPNPSVNDQVGCLFTKVNQNGQASPLPTTSVGWGQEIDLDIQMVSATCPHCKILLVESNNAYFNNIVIAEDRAAQMGANAISNSYGGSEFSSEGSSAYNGHYNHPGVAITVSSGDSGYGPQYPAASQYVTSVGGTSLVKNVGTTRGWTESAWDGAGSGCSSYISRPSWQPVIGSCSRRVIADVSAVADPSTGVAVYDSFGSNGGANWYVFGGTSVSAPIIAGVYALAGNAGGASPDIQYGEYPYVHTSSLFDVTSGSNGRCTNKRNNANAALCAALPGFDGPTGLGSPNGTGAF